MGSRLGSLIVLVALGVIVAVAALLVSRFSGGSDGDLTTLVVSLVQDQPVLLDEPLEVEVRARSGVPISIVALLVEGIIVNQATPVYDNEQGRYTAVLFWKPEALGFASLRIVVTDIDGTQTEIAVRVDVTDDTARVAQAQEAGQRAGQSVASTSASASDGATVTSGAQNGAASSGAAGDDAAGAAGRRGSADSEPRGWDGVRAGVGPTVRRGDRDIGHGAALERAVLCHTGAGGWVVWAFAAGAFGDAGRERDGQLSRGGARRGGVVRGRAVIRLAAGRADGRPAAAGGPDPDHGARKPRPPPTMSSSRTRSRMRCRRTMKPQRASRPILAILTARQDEDGLLVTVINTGSSVAERVEVDISLIRSRDASLLALSAALLTLEPDQRANIPLEVVVDEETEALIVLESDVDEDSTNNTFEIVLSPSAASEEQEEAQAEEEDEGAEDELAEEEEAEAEELPDLAFLEARFTDDGFALLTVVNAGAGAAGDFVINVVGEDGVVLETIERGASAAPLASRDSEILAGSVAHSGTVVIMLDPNNTTAESNESNNLIRVEVGP